jgi:hypothetical protein
MEYSNMTFIPRTEQDRIQLAILEQLKEINKKLSPATLTVEQTMEQEVKKPSRRKKEVTK